MTIEQKRRELFETKFRIPAGSEFNGCHYTGTFITGLTVINIQWYAFCAALDAVEIELPESWVPIDAQERGWEMMGKFRESIESTGLGLKVKS